MSVSSYPEQPTIAEQFISALRLPYSVGCGLVALLLGPPSQIFWAYLASYDLSRAYQMWVSKVLDVTGWISYLGYLLTVGYVFLVVRYVRRNLLKTEGTLSALLTNGERDFHKIFGVVSSLRWQLAAWAFYFVANLWGGLTLFPTRTTIDLVNFIVEDLISSLGISSALWVFFSSTTGIYRMGRSSLQLKPYQLDRHLGLRPVGSLALTLSLLFFGGLFLNGINNITLLISDVVYLSIELAVVLFGLLMFFLPMLRFHQVMTRLRHQERERLVQRQKEFLDNNGEGASHVNVDMLFLDMMERKVSSISTWPFDTQMLGKLLAVVSTITGILLSLLSVR